MQDQSNRRIDPVGVHAPIDLTGTTPVGWAAVCTRSVSQCTVCQQNLSYF